MSSTTQAGNHSPPTGQRDLWRLPTLLLWMLFFFIGLVPFPVYVYLRYVAGVVPQRALVNSHYVVTLALAAYVALFCFQRCREMAHTPFESQDKALQLGLLSLVAFLPFDYSLLLTVHMNPARENPSLFYVVGSAKLVSWLYLFSLFLRYYALGINNVFSEIPSLFPSAHRRKKRTNPATPRRLKAGGVQSSGEGDSEKRLPQPGQDSK